MLIRSITIGYCTQILTKFAVKNTKDGVAHVTETPPSQLPVAQQRRTDSVDWGNFGDGQQATWLECPIPLP